MIGTRFGRLVVVARADPRRSGQKMRTRAVVRCDCGVEKEIWGEQLKYAKTVSCGCIQKEAVASAALSHGHANTPLYKVWTAIKGRCRNPADPQYAIYGGRGIDIADEWASDFAAFYAYLGPRPSSRHSIDRIDNSRGYEPGNLRWATDKEQHRNKRNNHCVPYQGKMVPISQAIEDSGTSVPGRTVYNRISRGWTIERALA